MNPCTNRKSESENKVSPAKIILRRVKNFLRLIRCFLFRGRFNNIYTFDPLLHTGIIDEHRSSRMITSGNKLEEISFAKIYPRYRFLGGLRKGEAVVTIKIQIDSGTLGIGIYNYTEITLMDFAVLKSSSDEQNIRLYINNMNLIGPMVFSRYCSDRDPLVCRIVSIQMDRMCSDYAVDNHNTLIAFYDLNYYPVSFDFTFFLMHAEIERKKCKLTHIHVVFIPGDKNTVFESLPAGFYDAVDDAALSWRFNNILIPLTTLFPTVSGITVARDRVQGYALKIHATNFIPKEFEEGEAQIHISERLVNSILTPDGGYVRPRATLQGLRYIRRWIEVNANGRKVITITLRQYKFNESRNSSLHNWVRFSKFLNHREYFPVFIPDTDSVCEQRPKALDYVRTFPEVAMNLQLRMALYAEAYLNMGTSGGPMGLLFLSENYRYLVFKILVDSVPLCSKEHLLSLGFNPGESLPYSRVTQKLVWEDDEYEVIQREFILMCHVIGSGNGMSSKD